MGRNLDDVIKTLSAERQAKVMALSQKKVEDMIAHAATLTDFRKAVGKTQAEVAKDLGINQNAVSQLEKRSDTYVSTLRRFLRSLGLTLELSVVAKNGARIELPNFLQLDAETAAKNAEVLAVTSEVFAQKVAAKAAAPGKARTRTKAQPVRKEAAAAKAPAATKTLSAARAKKREPGEDQSRKKRPA